MKKSMSAVIGQAVVCLTLPIGALGQGPISDRLVVTLPNTTWVGSQSLAPGKYTIRQLPTASSPRLLEFSSDDGTTLEAAVTTIAAIDNNNRRETSVILQQQGGQYHLTHVWIAGKTYGYQIPVDESKQLASTSEKVTLAANYSPAPQEVAAVNPPAEPPAPAPQPVPEAAPAPVAQAPVQPERTAPQPEPAPVPPPAPPVQAQAPAPPELAPQRQTAAENAQLAAQTPPMPQTAGNWAEFTLLGLVLLTLGLFLSRQRGLSKS